MLRYLVVGKFWLFLWLLVVSDENCLYFEQTLLVVFKRCREMLKLLGYSFFVSL